MLQWRDSLDVDWHELEALYRAAPLGVKEAARLRTAFTNSMYRCFAYDAGKLVAAGRALADGVDCAMAIFENQQQQLERGYLGED